MPENKSVDAVGLETVRLDEASILNRNNALCAVFPRKSGLLRVFSTYCRLVTLTDSYYFQRLEVHGFKYDRGRLTTASAMWYQLNFQALESFKLSRISRPCIIRLLSS
jgi:hypothetical protein